MRGSWIWFSGWIAQLVRGGTDTGFALSIVGPWPLRYSLTMYPKGGPSLDLPVAVPSPDEIQGLPKHLCKPMKAEITQKVNKEPQNLL